MNLIEGMNLRRFYEKVQNDSLKHLYPDQHYKSWQDAMRKIIEKEGVQGLYAGLFTGLVGTVVSSFSYFYIYSSIRQNYEKLLKGKGIGTGMELLLGAAAGALCQFVVLPIGVVTTRYIS